jgi:hypothetical protein
MGLEERTSLKQTPTSIPLKTCAQIGTQRNSYWHLSKRDKNLMGMKTQLEGWDLLGGQSGHFNVTRTLMGVTKNIFRHLLAESTSIGIFQAIKELLFMYRMLCM